MIINRKKEVKEESLPVPCTMYANSHIAPNLYVLSPWPGTLNFLTSFKSSSSTCRKISLVLNKYARRERGRQGEVRREEE